MEKQPGRTAKANSSLDLHLQMISYGGLHQSQTFLTLQLCASSLSALWASIGFWMTRPPDLPEKSMATKVASDLDCSHTQMYFRRDVKQQRFLTTL